MSYTLCSFLHGFEKSSDCQVSGSPLSKNVAAERSVPSVNSKMLLECSGAFEALAANAAAEGSFPSVDTNVRLE